AASVASELPPSARKAAPGLLTSPDWRKAMTATQAGRWSEALRLIQKVSRTYPRDPWLSLNMARTLVELGQKEQAIDWARKVLSTCPDDTLALDVLLHCLTVCRRFAEAVAVVESHGHQSHHSVEMYADLAYQQILVGERGESITTLMKGLFLQMDHGRSHFLMGVA